MTCRCSFVFLALACVALAGCPHPTPMSATPFGEIDKPAVEPDKATIYIFNDGPVEESPVVWVESWDDESRAHDDHKLEVVVGDLTAEGFTWFYAEPGTRRFWLRWGDDRTPAVSHEFDILPGRAYYFKLANLHRGVHGRTSWMYEVSPRTAIETLDRCCRHVPARQPSY